MKHYPHHIGDFNNATRHLSRIERSLYRDMIDLYYETEQFLSLDVSSICRRIVANEFSTDVERLLNEFFTETPNGWYHDRCEEELSKYRANNSQRAIAGKASAASKALKKQQALNGDSTSVERTLNRRSTKVQRENITNQPINQSTNIKEKSADAPPTFELPDWIDKTHWDAWHSCPKRKKATDDQKQLAVKKLDAWRLAGIDHASALENAAIGGWQGLFKPDQQATRPGGGQLNKQEALEASNAAVAERFLRNNGYATQ